MAMSQSDLLVPGMLMRSGGFDSELWVTSAPLVVLVLVLLLLLLLLLPASTAVRSTLEHVLSSCEWPGSVAPSSNANSKSAAEESSLSSCSSSVCHNAVMFAGCPVDTSAAARTHGLTQKFTPRRCCACPAAFHFATVVWLLHGYRAGVAACKVAVIDFGSRCLEQRTPPYEAAKWLKISTNFSTCQTPCAAHNLLTSQH
jgi:hypothetical protein